MRQVLNSQASLKEATVLRTARTYTPHSPLFATFPFPERLPPPYLPFTTVLSRGQGEYAFHLREIKSLAQGHPQGQKFRAFWHCGTRGRQVGCPRHKI